MIEITHNQKATQPPAYEDIYPPPYQNLPPEYHTDSLSNINTVYPGRYLEIFLKDLGGFFLNVILLPVQFEIFYFRTLIYIGFFPLILAAETINIILGTCVTLLTCGCVTPEKRLAILSFNPTEPTDDEAESLRHLVQDYGTHQMSEEKQIHLLHIVDQYLTFCDRYSSGAKSLLMPGKENDQARGLIKVNIDGQARLFQFSPISNREQLLAQYLRFISRHGQRDSHVKHTFVTLDYSHFFGFMKMKTLVDIVEYPSIGSQPLFHGVRKRLWGFLRPKLWRHRAKNIRRAQNFHLWPGYTRRFCAHIINKELGTERLTPYHINLSDFENIIEV